MSLAYDPNKPEYPGLPGSISAAQREHEMSQMNGDPYGNDHGGGNDGGGCSGIIFIGIIIMAVLSVFEGAFKGSKRGSGGTTPPPPPPPRQQIHYLGMVGPKIEWSKVLARKPRDGKTTITVDNNSSASYLFYTFRNQGTADACGPMYRELVVRGNSKRRIDCNVGQVFAVVDEESGRFVGAVTAEPRAGVLPFW